MNISRNTVRSYVREFEKNIALLESISEQEQIAMIQDEISKKPKRKSYTAKKRKFNPDVEKAF